MHPETTQFQSALGRAIALWSQGRRINLDIAAELIEQGYDLQSLERRHFKTR
jgi:hypothetical protein